MKANEAPIKIYLQVCGDCQDKECDNCKFEDLEDNVTWCKDKIFDKDVEYTRTDAFIEKTAEWIDNFLSESTLIDYKVTPIVRNAVIENFKNYMKGE